MEASRYRDSDNVIPGKDPDEELKELEKMKAGMMHQVEEDLNLSPPRICYTDF